MKKPTPSKAREAWNWNVSRLSPEIARDPVADALRKLADQVFSAYEQNMSDMRDMYLDLLKRTLTGMAYADPAMSVAWRPDAVFNVHRRSRGRDWPQHAQTMIGMSRLDNLQECIERVICDGIPGDFIETGVWRGGACIFMRAMLQMYEITDRSVWVADSFMGLPQNPERDDDAELAGQPDQGKLAVSMTEVQRNFARYNLLDDRVKFIKGWFSDTLPGPVGKLSILRLDSDLYMSTMSSIAALYPLLQPGGYCIVDDWNVDMARMAVTKYRADHDIAEPINDIDGHSIYWRKEI